MALTTPVLAPIPYFDASNAQTLTFTVRGGDQVVANTITIKNNATLEVVYTARVTSFKLEHLVPAGTLTNGTYYQATIKTKNAAGQESNESNAVQFYCYAQPSFAFTNIVDEGEVGNSSYAFNVRYNNTTPNANEYLNEFVFNLYSAAGTLLSTSGAQYNSSKTLPLDLSYLFSGLVDKTAYMVEVVGVTTGGRQITTGKVGFTTTYTQPSLYSYIYLTNQCQEGYITIDCNVVAIIGKIDGGVEPVYTDGGTALDAREHGVTWDDGYEITNGYTTRIWGRAFTPDGEVLRFSNTSGDTVSLVYREDATKAWWELRVKNLDFAWAYIIKSATITKPDDADQVFAWLRQSGDLYDIIIENLGGERLMLSFVGYNFCSDINSLDPMVTMIRSITTTKLANGIFDHFNVTSNTTMDYNHTKPTDWDFDTIMDCNFDGNVNAGNLEQITADITAVKVKRRVKGTFDWMTIKTVEITKPEDFIFTFNDTTTASGVEYEYAYVPLMANTEGTIVEGEYNIQEILSQFDGVFICDVNTVFKFYANVTYGTMDAVHQVGTYTALGRKYPIIISNGLVDYKQGNISGDIMPPNYMRDGKFDRAAIVQQREALLKFLNNKKPKVIKDWNGNQWLVYITGNPSVSFDDHSGMGWNTMAADWTEIGNPNSKQDMYEAGMIPEGV